MPKWRGKFRSLKDALIGRPAKSPPRDLDGVFGYTGIPKTKSGSWDTKAAAQKYGVSRRTVERWIHNGRIPDGHRSPGGREAQKQTGQEWQKRETRRQQTRRQRMTSQPRPVKISGWIRVSEDLREREVGGDNTKLDPDQVEKIYDAYYTTGEDAALDSLSEAFADAYGVPGMEIETLDSFDL